MEAEQLNVEGLLRKVRQQLHELIHAVSPRPAFDSFTMKLDVHIPDGEDDRKARSRIYHDVKAQLSSLDAKVKSLRREIAAREKSTESESSARPVSAGWSCSPTPTPTTRSGC